MRSASERRPSGATRKQRNPSLPTVLIKIRFDISGAPFRYRDNFAHWDGLGALRTSEITIR